MLRPRVISPNVCSWPGGQRSDHSRSPGCRAGASQGCRRPGLRTFRSARRGQAEASAQTKWALRCGVGSVASTSRRTFAIARIRSRALGILGPARREDAGPVVERLDTEAAVVGERGQAGKVRRRARLEVGIVDEGGTDLVGLGQVQLGRARRLDAIGPEQLAISRTLPSLWLAITSRPARCGSSPRGLQPALRKSPRSRSAPAGAAAAALPRRTFAFGGDLRLHQLAVAGQHEIAVASGRAVLGIIEVEHRCAVVNAAADRRDLLCGSDRPRSACFAISPSTASRSATQAPEIAAVRVPPSAWMTSQSSEICRSPSASRSTTARRRPSDQPLDFLRAAGLLARRRLAPAARVGRARQHAIFGRDPAAPLPRSQGGTFSSTLAVQSTRVSPKLTRQQPSA